MRLEGKTALITGGNEGIGKATALMFVKEGARVAVTGRRKEKLDEVVEESGGKIVAIQGDVSNEAQVKAAVDEFIKQFGRIDILFNNAGVLESGTAVTTTVESWDKMIDINVKGMFFMTKEVLPHMQKQGAGVIINNGSVLSHIGCQNAIAYNTSKGAVLQFTKSLAVDHAKEGIRVNAICPGFIMTKMNDDFIGNPPDAQKQLDEIAAQIVPLGYRGEVNDIAYALVYMASDEAKYMTGASLIVDGGWSCY
jgi:NAD(P)-dependent dehydrogenase (short-subunit alcohol dehydrogenase family)